MRSSHVATQSLKINDPWQATLAPFELNRLQLRPIVGAMRFQSPTKYTKAHVLYNVEWQQAMAVSCLRDHENVASNAPRKWNTSVQFNDPKLMLSFTLPKVMRDIQLHRRHATERLGHYTGMLQSVTSSLLAKRSGQTLKMQVSLPHEPHARAAPVSSSHEEHSTIVGYAMAAMMGTVGHEATSLKYRMERHDLASNTPIFKLQSKIDNDMVATDAFGAICGAGSESHPMLVRSVASMGEASQSYIADRRDGLQRKLLILGGLGGLGSLVSSWTMANGCNV
eukprot:scaffold675847_cov57-Prasinocladus_malaysianus.AAC.1